ncbi:alanine dehydrogenase [Exilibacterium tricleocarpae]|uniref:Alanine dehydrogenase n=1 Tax=Exilibacterium tricleocarpae TaxID=2591008 RepID=A0A545T5X3_9GAMM|nr:alanine dehydrogenase [Exilibacterium tricleocarpae]TQV72619.1 alanine dehydrogenase [Exilibacterium tricleocarpae]
MTSYSAFRQVALVKEVESPENPGALERRVALVPADVERLCRAGLSLYVEHGAGAGVGFDDADYQAAGAILQDSDAIYADKDLVIKFKGPSLDAIDRMRPGSTLFCMAHFHSYPDRAERLQRRRINVIAMEEVLESPKHTSDATILSRTAMAAALQPFIANGTIQYLDVRVIGWTSALAGCIRRAGNRSPATLQVLSRRFDISDADVKGPTALYFYDSESFDDAGGVLAELRDAGCRVVDRADFVATEGAAAIEKYRATHPPHEFGLRRIQCLHETGQAGARYGFELLRRSKPGLTPAQAKVVVLGYGNVGSGAIREAYDQGAERVHILGRRHTARGAIEHYLRDADLIINGAEQPPELRGKNFLISRAHVSDLIPKGSVIIDLVGGSPTNRSPVESVVSCTFLTDPYFEEAGVLISSLWGWPMMGMMRETAVRYSSQITEVLIGREQLVAGGLDALAPGVAVALVCGPFSAT